MILQEMKWTREPAAYSIGSDKIEITTMPHTDLWQRTYYHFRNDNAPVLQLETGEHPAVLKDQVCSPAGTTIRGCAALEEAGFRNACIKSIDAVMNSGL